MQAGLRLFAPHADEVKEKAEEMENEDENEKERDSKHRETLTMTAACGCATMESRARARAEGDCRTGGRTCCPMIGGLGEGITALRNSH